MKNGFKRIIATVLCLAILFTSVPTVAVSVLQDEYIIENVDFELNTEDGGNGSYEVYGSLYDIYWDSRYVIGTSDWYEPTYGYMSFFNFNGTDYVLGDIIDPDGAPNDSYTVINFSDVNYDSDNKTYTYQLDDNFIIEMDFVNVDDTTVKVVYKFKNISGNNADIKIANVSEPMMDYQSDDMYEISVSKVDNNKIVSTLDDDYFEYSGIQVVTEMNPAPTTRFIDDFYCNEDDCFFTGTRYSESDKDYMIADPNAYPVIEFSWSDSLTNNEEKTYEVTYTMNIWKDVTLKFYPKKGSRYDSRPIYRYVKKGGRYVLPQIDKSHYAEGMSVGWSDGTNIYEPGTFLVAPTYTKEYYEVVYKDESVSPKYSVTIDGQNINIFKDDNDITYEEGETVSFELDDDYSNKFDKFKVYPLGTVDGDIISRYAGAYSFTMPAHDVFLEPILKDDNRLYFNVEYVDRNTLPRVTCECTAGEEPIEFTYEFIDENNQVVTKLENNKVYGGHITIDASVNEKMHMSGYLYFNEIIFGAKGYGVSEYRMNIEEDTCNNSTGASQDEVDEIIENFDGAFIDENNDFNIYFRYAHVSDLEISLNNVKDGEEIATSCCGVEFDATTNLPEIYGTINEDTFIMASPIDLPDDEDIPSTYMDGHRYVLLFELLTNITGRNILTDVEHFTIKPGTNSNFYLNNFSKEDTQRVIYEVMQDGMSYYGISQLKDKFISLPGMGIISVAEVVMGDKPASTHTTKKYKATDNNDTAEKITGTGKKGSTRTIVPEEGRKVSSVIVTDKDGNKIDVTFNEDGTYSFTQPASNVNVEVNYKNREITLNIGSTDASVDGEHSNLDVAPVIRNDRTMLPIRFVAENLGAKVEWSEKKPNYVAIIRGDTKIEITLGSDIMLVNGKEVKIDSVAFAENDRTYLPVRAVSEALNAVVEWNESRPNEVKIYEQQ